MNCHGWDFGRSTVGWSRHNLFHALKLKAISNYTAIAFDSIYERSRSAYWLTFVTHAMQIVHTYIVWWSAAEFQSLWPLFRSPAHKFISCQQKDQTSPKLSPEKVFVAFWLCLLFFLILTTSWPIGPVHIISNYCLVVWQVFRWKWMKQWIVGNMKPYVSTWRQCHRIGRGNNGLRLHMRKKTCD